MKNLIVALFFFLSLDVIAGMRGHDVEKMFKSSAPDSVTVNSGEYTCERFTSSGESENIFQAKIDSFLPLYVTMLSKIVPTSQWPEVKVFYPESDGLESEIDEYTVGRTISNSNGTVRIIFKNLSAVTKESRETLIESYTICEKISILHL